MARDRQLSLELQGAGVATPARLWWICKVQQLEPVLVSAALAVSLHAVVFSVPVRGQHLPAAATDPSASHAIQVRTVPAPNANSANADGGSSAGPHLAAGSIVDSQPTRSHALTGRDTGMPAGVDNERVSPPAIGLALRIPGALGDADFFSRDALDVGPSPVRPVLIDFPSVSGVSGIHTGILSLFIDETGKVVRVRVDTQTFPPEMQEAARSAFMGAVFTPGLVDGLPIRSRIRVEVTFEAGTASR